MNLIDLVTIRTTDNRTTDDMLRWYAARAEALSREVARLSAENYRDAIDGDAATCERVGR